MTLNILKIILFYFSWFILFYAFERFACASICVPRVLGICGGLKRTTDLLELEEQVGTENGTRFSRRMASAFNCGVSSPTQWHWTLSNTRSRRYQRSCPMLYITALLLCLFSSPLSQSAPLTLDDVFLFIQNDVMRHDNVTLTCVVLCSFFRCSG